MEDPRREDGAPPAARSHIERPAIIAALVWESGPDKFYDVPGMIAAFGAKAYPYDPDADLSARQFRLQGFLKKPDATDPNDDTTPNLFTFIAVFPREGVSRFEELCHSRGFVLTRGDECHAGGQVVYSDLDYVEAAGILTDTVPATDDVYTVGIRADASAAAEVGRREGCECCGCDLAVE
jgi:hypothetical protein